MMGIAPEESGYEECQVPRLQKGNEMSNLYLNGGPLFRFHHHQKVSDAGSVAPRHKRVASDQKGTAYKT